jgi:protein-disulfide isomerase/type II secretory pathway component PulC
MIDRPLRAWAGLVLGAASLLVGACSPNDEAATGGTCFPGAEQKPPPQKESAVVARVGGEPVTLDELDAALRLKLHDLERAKYALREQRLVDLIRERLDKAGRAESPQQSKDPLQAAIESGRVEILLEPPNPPRASIDIGGAPLRGAPGAPVTLLVFCDFESPHCARVEPTLRRLLQLYAGQLRIAWRALPLPFHRRARQAAEAARCADEQGEFWSYHDALYLQQEDLSRASLERTARTLELDLTRFRECLDERRSAAAIDADLDGAEQLGLTSVPISFVNGLYLKGPRPEAAFRGLIDAELTRLGLEPPRKEGRFSTEPPFPGRASRTDLPLTLSGTVVSEDSSRSLAIIRIEGRSTARLFTEGDRVLGEVTLDSVHQARVYLRRGNLLEYLPLASGGEARTGYTEKGAATPSTPEAAGILRLRRAAVNGALERRTQLEDDLEAGRLDLQGKRLLKLTRVEPGGLYEMLGLEPRDVILQVNGEWIHDQDNPLWRTLRGSSRVTVVVMRRGLPKTLVYEIR